VIRPSESATLRGKALADQSNGKDG